MIFFREMATFCKFSVESAMDEIEKLKGTKRDHEKKKGIVFCINFLYAWPKCLLIWPDIDMTRFPPCTIMFLKNFKRMMCRTDINNLNYCFIFRLAKNF